VTTIGLGRPTPPIQLGGDGAASTTAHLVSPTIGLNAELIRDLEATGALVTVDPATLSESSRDWWPLAMTWAADNQVAALAAAVVQPTTVEQVSAILRLCNASGIPVTPAAGRSGVVGGSVPLFGGVILDMCALTGIRSVDQESGIVDVWAGTFGDLMEAELRSAHGLTVGHWPQSVSLSTIGGWLACRGAGQLSNRYGKIEDIVVGLDVVLADGTFVQTGGHARQAAGPDLDQLFVGSEGTLGVITAARLRAWKIPEGEARSAWSFPSFEEGADACRRIVQRGLAPAALRLYDAAEADRSYGTGDVAVLLVFDEGDPVVVDAASRITEQECAGTNRLDDSLVEKWLGHRNDVSALEALISKGFVVDTMELTVSWTELPNLYVTVRDAIAAVPGVLAASAHLSHSYSDGACLYFTFAGKPSEDNAVATDALYTACWDAGARAGLACGGSLSHHHGIGINRARFMDEALGDGGTQVLHAIKDALDPAGVLNPGKLGMPNPFGPAPFPVESGAEQ
jgi:alkyldihydroxyacetonephosphate synthase